MKRLEFTNEMMARNDDIDNSVFNCICELVEQEIEWDMEIIGDVTDSIIKVLKTFNLKVRQPSIVEDSDGNQHYEDYD